MKRVCILLIFFLAAQYSYGQCAIYVSTNTVWTTSYRTPGETIYNLEEVKQAGFDDCKNRRGANCRLLYAGKEGGWWGLIRGTTAKGEIKYVAVSGEASESEARFHLYRKYERGKGIKPETAEIKTWFVVGG